MQLADSSAHGRSDVVDLVVIGGGIVGVATALQLSKEYSDLSIRLIEKERNLAQHQSGNNSGVVHAGVYYQPGSLKAKFCRDGAGQIANFCEQFDLPFDRCGKLIVATDESELGRLNDLFGRCQQNDLDPVWVDQAELQRLEKNIAGCAAVSIESSAITDYSAIVESMAKQFLELGGAIEFGCEVAAMSEDSSGVSIKTSSGEMRATYAVACGGLMADRLAHMCGVDLDFRIIPFRGEYYRLRESRNGIVRHLIYPVPDPSLPFLGIHLTRTIDGRVTIGPNAVLALAREGYTWGCVDARDLADMFTFSGTYRVIRNHWKSGWTEFTNSVSRRRFLDSCRRYCPSLTLDDLEPHSAGVRAQAVLRDGTLVQDFMIRRTRRSFHVCNAPSPAATSSMSIAQYLVKKASATFGLADVRRG